MAMRVSTQLLDQLPRAVWVAVGGVQQGFPEGITIPLLTDTRPILSTHVLVLLPQVGAKPQEARSTRRTAIALQAAQENNINMTTRRFDVIW